MKTCKKLIVTIVLFSVLGLSGTAIAQQWYEWAEFTIVRITSHKDGDVIPTGSTQTFTCVHANDVDVPCNWRSNPQYPIQYDESLKLQWSGDGQWGGTEGPSVTWTAPASACQVVIRVDANDDDFPDYNDHDTNRYHSITLSVVGTNIIHVNQAVSGGSKNGSSWANAYQYLQNAFDAASSGDEIWVAKGTYYPDDGNSVTENSHYETFELVGGVAVYGGFDATETARAQRDWIKNETILSGEINTASLTDNSHAVVTGSGSATTILDGFTITRGYSHVGLCDGAGMNNVNCSPTVASCVFEDNKADTDDGDGGGMNNLTSSPTVTNCIFISNVAGDDGGALANKKGSHGTFMNCAFYNNSTEGDNNNKSDGGAIWNTRGENAGQDGSNPTFINCVIAGNATVRYGGGAANKGSGTDPNYFNCTFYNNNAGVGGDGIGTKENSVTTVTNCILWNSDTDAIHEIWTEAGSTTDVDYSDVKGSHAGTKNKDIDPNFVNTGDFDGPDGRFLTCDDGLRIMFDSNCIDAGDGDAKDDYSDVATTDALGLKNVDIRTVTDWGTGSPSYVDMGAYEAVVEHVIFISVDGMASEYLDELVDGGDVPKIKRFIDEGLWTYNARTDAEHTNTIPNHVTMVTGRPVLRGSLTSSTTHHGYTSNSTPDPGTTLHNSGNAPGGYLYKASCFEVVHDAGMTTALYGGKDKFAIFEFSYNEDCGANHANGRDKIDTYEWTPDHSSLSELEADWASNELMRKFIKADKPEYDFNFTFLHFKGGDKAGHDDGWGNSEWDANMVAVDGHLDTIFNMVEDDVNHPAWYANTIIVISADHGGHGGGHGTRSTDSRDFTIPFGVWGHLIPKGDIYDWCNQSRTPPGVNDKVAYNDGYSSQPVRHADGPDLGLNLMGLPAINGALIKNMEIGYDPQP